MVSNEEVLDALISGQQVILLPDNWQPTYEDPEYEGPRHCAISALHEVGDAYSLETFEAAQAELDAVSMELTGEFAVPGNARGHTHAMRIYSEAIGRVLARIP
jgi:hypothetical protein